LLYAFGVDIFLLDSTPTLLVFVNSPDDSLNSGASKIDSRRVARGRRQVGLEDALRVWHNALVLTNDDMAMKQTVTKSAVLVALHEGFDGGMEYCHGAMGT